MNDSEQKELEKQLPAWVVKLAKMLEEKKQR
jgi:hypothetical protein